MDQSRADNEFVYIIDDDESPRRAIDSLCRSVGLHARSYASVKDFLDVKVGDLAGCLVLDVRLQGISGLDFQSQLLERGIDLPVIFITGHADVLMSVRAMKSGAVDFLPKPFRDQDLLDAITAAIGRDRRRRAMASSSAILRERFLTLSAREQQVMMLVTKGMMNKQVAGDLRLSEITVKLHRGAAMRKMGARTLVDLVRMADNLKQNPP